MFVTDVASCAWLSRQMDPLNTVLVIDEPTMGADQGGGEAMAATSLTGFMVQAMLAGPHKMVWMSATLPPKDKLPAPVAHFKQRFGVGDDAVDELVSMQLNVGVLLVKADGTVAMPHSMCAEGGAEGCAAKLQDFVERLRCEPLLIKAYTAQAIIANPDPNPHPNPNPNTNTNPNTKTDTNPNPNPRRGRGSCRPSMRRSWGT